MANANFAFGIRPIADNGTMWTGQARLVYFPSSVAVNVFLGDPLIPLGGCDANGVPAVTVATAGDNHPILGGFLGISEGPAGSIAGNQYATFTQFQPIYRQTALPNYGYVVDAPDQLYAVQEDSDGGAIAVTTGGYANGNLASGSGSTSTGFSGWQLDSSSVATGATTNQVKVLGLLRGPDNAIGNYAKWVVRLNNPVLGSATIGY